MRLNLLGKVDGEQQIMEAGIAAQRVEDLVDAKAGEHIGAFSVGLFEIAERIVGASQDNIRSDQRISVNILSAV